jgi:hypothetical protein
LGPRKVGLSPVLVPDFSPDFGLGFELGLEAALPDLAPLVGLAELVGFLEPLIKKFLQRYCKFGC